MKKKSNGIPETYIERDISWMYFNQRILLEAQKTSVPLLERLCFLGIYSNNLDEFFRVRVASLNRIINYEGKALNNERKIALKTFKEINRLNSIYSDNFEKTFQDIDNELKQNNIWILNETELNDEQKQYIRQLYDRQLNGSTNPLFISSFRQLNDQPDDDIYLAIRLSVKNTNKTRQKETDYALIELPVKEFGRLLRLPNINDKICLIFLDDVVRFCLPFIFEGTSFSCFDAYTFKFTKDAEMELETDLRNSVMQKIAKGVKSRKKGEPIRLVYDNQMPIGMLRRITQMLNIDRWDTRVAGGRYHNMKDLMKFPDCNRANLKYAPMFPIYTLKFNPEESLSDHIREKDRFLHYPFHSFSSFLRLLREAAIDQNVHSIKMTLYRLAKDSKVIKTLICAARNGKKVTVVIELLARFDEASNISWSKQMQDAGIKVIFGVEGLKVHSKLLHIGNTKGDIACISTGNFHEGNANQYTDITILTARKKLVQEVNFVFDFIEKPYTPIKFRELLVSPNSTRNQLIRWIDREIRNARAGKIAYIQGKVNHITDKIIIEKLYEASRAGVNIDLLVRGNCSVVTGIPGISDRIRINGIIDRYLEHSRIFIFANGGKETYIIGSADWMTRNFDSRIEVMAPVYDKEIQTELKQIITYGLQDSFQGRIVDGSGRNLPWTISSEDTVRSQVALYKHYLQKTESLNTYNHE